jgi:hypothetical protein
MPCCAGGNFVCKLFDAYTPFTVGLLQLLYRHFEKFCLVKPCVPKHTATDLCTD